MVVHQLVHTVEYTVQCDMCDDDRASSLLVGGAESLHCDCVSCDSITPLDTIIMTKTANVTIVKNDID